MVRTLRPHPALHVRVTPLRRVAAAVTVLGASAALLSGCSSAQGATTLDTAAKTSITVWTGQEDAAQAVLEPLAREFEADHPNVTIKMSSGASSTEDLLQKLSAGFVGNSYPDVSYTFGSWASQLERSGRTLDITEKVSNPDVKWDEFSQAARDTAQPTGAKTIGFPAIVDNLSLIYNKTLFDKAGLAYPTNDWSWDEFRTAALKLTDASQNTYGYAYSVSGSEETTWQLWPHLWQNGGSILSSDSSTAAFDQQPGIDALTFLQGMAVDDKSVYLDQTDTKFGALFASDRIGMITSGPWQLSDLKTAGTNYGVAFLPGTDGDHETVSGPDLWTLFDHKDVNRAHWSYEFTKWLTDAAQDERWNLAIGNLPLRSSEVDSEAFTALTAEFPGLDVMAANIANAKQARPTVPGYVGLSTAVGTAVSEVLQGQGSPADALKTAADTSNTALKKD